MKRLSQQNGDQLSNYFKTAKSWAEDNFARVELSRYRYQLAFLIAMALNIITIVVIAVLANANTLVPMMVHHYDNGITTVEPLTQNNAPLNKTQVESDLVRYLTNRESYDLSSYRAQFELINLLSNSTVNGEYLREQAKSTANAPINTLGANTYRSVHVYSINFLDNLIFNEKDLPKNHQNVAEIVFSLIDTERTTGKQTSHHYNALVSWRYLKPSDSPNFRWQNWDGFQVTRYSKQERNV